MSCYSTAIIEALQAGVPVVYLGLSPVQKLMGVHHFTRYAREGLLLIATTTSELATHIVTLAKDPELRKQYVRHAEEFLTREYLFDGHASERAAALITALASGKAVT